MSTYSKITIIFNDLFKKLNSLDELKKLWNTQQTKKRINSINKRKKEYKSKHPNCAYIFFLQEIRPKIKEENPDLDSKKIMCIAGERWRNLNNKSKYEELAQEDKIRYKEQIKQYNK